MQRTLIMSTVASGPGSWNVEVSISRNERSGAWTLYFRSSDPAAPASVRHGAKDALDFLQIFSWRGVNPLEFCGHLERASNPALHTLAQALLADALG